MTDDGTTFRVTTGQAPYDQVPRWLRRLGAHPYLTYAALVSFSGERGCFPSMPALAERALISESGVRRALRVLVEAGAVRVDRSSRANGASASNTYHLDAYLGDPHGASVEPSTVPPGHPQGATLAPPISEREPGERELDTDVSSVPAVIARDEYGFHPTADTLCLQLADHVEASGFKRPTVSKEWRRHARLMLDQGEWSDAQVGVAIRWLATASRDAIFWNANVLSMPKLRAQMPKLAAAIRRERELADARPMSRGDRIANADLTIDPNDPFTKALEKVRAEGRPVSI